MPTRQILFMLLPHLLETCEQKTQNPERSEKLIKVLNSFPFLPWRRYSKVVQYERRKKKD